MKVSIIGGGGLVGCCAAYALQCGGLASEIFFLDVNQELAIAVLRCSSGKGARGSLSAS